MIVLKYIISFALFTIISFDCSLSDKSDTSINLLLPRYKFYKNLTITRNTFDENLNQTLSNDLQKFHRLIRPAVKNILAVIDTAFKLVNDRLPLNDIRVKTIKGICRGIHYILKHSLYNDNIQFIREIGQNSSVILKNITNTIIDIYETNKTIASTFPYTIAENIHLEILKAFEKCFRKFYYEEILIKFDEFEEICNKIELIILQSIAEWENTGISQLKSVYNALYDYALAERSITVYETLNGCQYRAFFEGLVLGMEYKKKNKEKQ